MWTSKGISHSGPTRQSSAICIYFRSPTGETTRTTQTLMIVENHSKNNRTQDFSPFLRKCLNLTRTNRCHCNQPFHLTRYFGAELPKNQSHTVDVTSEAGVISDDANDGRLLPGRPTSYVREIGIRIKSVSESS